MQPAANIWFQCVTDILVYEVEIKPLGIEVPTTPTLDVGVFGVFNIAHHLEEVLISRGSADVFRRSSKGTVLADGLFGKYIEPEPFLKFNRMAPVVAEVICVGKSASRSRKILKLNIPFIENARIIWTRPILQKDNITKAQSADMKFVKMVVPPIERGLNSKVEVFEIPVCRYDQTPPDGWLDTINRYTKANGVRR